MKTFEIHYKFTFHEVSEVEADSLEEAIEKFDIDETICSESDMDPTSAESEVVTEECREVLPNDWNFQPHCSICSNAFSGPGNNAAPLADGRCCDTCNATRVVPARIEAIMKTNDQ